MTRSDPSTRPGRDLLRIEEAADRLSLGRSKVYELIREGRLPVVHIGRSVRIAVRSLDEFIDELIGGDADARGGWSE